MSIVKKITIMLSALFGAISLHAQQFSYSVSCDSSGTYEELTTQTLLNPGGETWAFQYKVPVGFAFSFLGQSFDSVSIERNGYLSFDRDRSYAIMAFNAFTDKVDSSGNRSVLSYALSGSNGSRILKIQFKNTGQSSAPRELLTYQLWLRESGAIEVHLGPHTYALADSSTYYDTLQPALIGLINTNMNTAARGLFLSGSPTQPVSQPVNDEHPDIAFLRSIGRAGTKYTFTPQQ